MSIDEEPIGKSTPEWPYPVNYDKENEVSTDVLVLSGELAGCHAAKMRAKVVVVDKASIRRSLMNSH